MNYSNNERKLVYLLAKLESLAILIFSQIANTEYEFKYTLIILRHRQNNFNKMRSNLAEPQQRLNSLNQKQETSSWLTTLLIRSYIRI